MLFSLLSLMSLHCGRMNSIILHDACIDCNPHCVLGPLKEAHLHFFNIGDAFIQSNLQMRNTTEQVIKKHKKCCNRKFKDCSEEYRLYTVKKYFFCQIFL